MKIHSYNIEVTGSQFAFCSKLYVLGDNGVLSALPPCMEEWAQAAITIGAAKYSQELEAPGTPAFQD